MRQSVESLTALLRSWFGPLETVPSLYATLHAQMQLEGESLADNSRVLMRWHRKGGCHACGKTGASTASPPGQCAQGTVCSWSATAVSSCEDSLWHHWVVPFFQIRNGSLLLLREDGEHSRRKRGITTCVDQVQSAPWSQFPCLVLRYLTQYFHKYYKFSHSCNSKYYSWCRNSSSSKHVWCS